MNKIIEKFLQKNDVNINNFDQYLYKIKSDSEINPILKHYRIDGRRIKKQISICDILGYNYECLELSNNLVHNLSHFFNADGTTYQKRSIGMVQYDAESALSVLREVCLKDTMYVSECENNKYVVSDNGLHRYNVLRFHYLNELSKLDKNDTKSINILNTKYTIPVEVQNLDYFKTYCYFLLAKYRPNYTMMSEYNSNYELTGNVTIHSDEGKSQIMTDDNLLAFIQKLVQENQLSESKLDVLNYYKENIPTFKIFLETNFPELKGDKEWTI